MDNFFWPTLATAVGGLLVAAVTALWSRHAPPPDHGSSSGHRVVIDGDSNQVQIGNTVTVQQQINNVRNETVRAGSNSDDDTWLVIGLTALACVAAALVFLVGWQLLTWLAVGASIVTMGSAGWMLRITERGAGRRWATFASTAVGALGTVGAAVLVLTSPGGGATPTQLREQVAARYPAMDGSMVDQVNVVTAHPGDVLKLIGLRGITSLTFQCVAIVVCLLVTVLNVQRLGQWFAFRQVAYGNTTNERTIGRAANFLTGGRGIAWATTLMMVIALGFSSGLITRMVSSNDPLSKTPASRASNATWQ